MANILCCLCGIQIQSNLKNMCNRCFSNEIDVKSKIKTRFTLEQCRQCERFFIPPNKFKSFTWNSQEFLIFCLSKNKNLKKFNLTDSSFLYTEENSKKVEIEIKIENSNNKENITSSTTKIVLSYRIINKQCKDCMRSESKIFWNSLVQLRQKPANKRTFLFIEQLILKHKAHVKTSNIKHRKDGIDFYFLNKTEALRLVAFIGNFLGTKTTSSNRLISEDRNNNSFNNKNTFSVEVLPLNKDEMVLIGKKGLENVFVVQKANFNVILKSPFSSQEKKISSKKFFNNEIFYKPLQRSEDFEKYKVICIENDYKEFMDITIINIKENKYYENVRTTLRLKEEDIVLGYNIINKDLGVDFGDREIILIRKFNNHKKNYKLKTNYVVDDELRLFLEDIEKDKQMLENICLYNEDDKLITDMKQININT